MERAEFISPPRVFLYCYEGVVAVSRGLTTSHLIYPLSRVMFDSFFVANTTTRDDYADSESLHPSLITRNPKALLMRI